MNFKRIYSSKIVIRTVILAVVDILFFSQINAQKANSQELIIGFGLFMLSVYVFLYALVHLLTLYGLPVHRFKKLTFYLAITAGLIIGLQSTGELTLKDVIILIPLSYIGYAYSNFLIRRTRQID